MDRTPSSFPGPRAYGVTAIVLALGLLATGATQSEAQKETPPAADADLKWLADSGYGFITVRYAQMVTEGPLGKLLSPDDRNDLLPPLRRAGFQADQIERLSVVLLPPGEMPLVLVTMRKPYDRAAIRTRMTPGGKTWSETPRGTLEAVTDPRTKETVVFVDPQRVLFGLETGVKEFTQRVQKGNRSPYAEAAGLARDHQLVVALAPESLLGMWQSRGAVAPDPIPVRDPVPSTREPGGEKKPDQPKGPPEEIDFRSFAAPEKPTLADLLADIPAELLPYKPLFLARTLTLTLDFAAEARLTAKLEYANEADARDGETAVKTALYVTREQAVKVFGGTARKAVPDLDAFLTAMTSGLRQAPVQRTNTVVTTTVVVKLDTKVLAALASDLQERRLRVRQMNQLKQVALAMHNYHDSFGHLPPYALHSKDGKPLLSWRVALLPYLEELKLYEQFKLDEPWDSEHNRKLLDRVPAAYAPVLGKAPIAGGTYLQAVVGRGALFDPAFGKERGATLVQIADGTSNTLMLVEASKAVPWTAPQDVPYDPTKVPALGGQFPEGFYAATADGAVHLLRRDMKPAILHALITPAGGEVFDWDQAVVPQK